MIGILMSSLWKYLTILETVASSELENLNH